MTTIDKHHILFHDFFIESIKSVDEIFENVMFAASGWTMKHDMGDFIRSDEIIEFFIDFILNAEIEFLKGLIITMVEGWLGRNGWNGHGYGRI